MFGNGIDVRIFVFINLFFKFGGVHKYNNWPSYLKFNKMEVARS